MTDTSILTQLPIWHLAPQVQKTSVNPHDLHTFWSFRTSLPNWITDSPTIMRCWELLAPLDWAHLPKRNLQRDWGQPTIPYAAFLASELIRLNEPLPTPERLHRFLIEHPGFIWLFGFPLVPDFESNLGFNPRVSLPTPWHFVRLLRGMPNLVAQFLLADSVRLMRAELRRLHTPPIDCASLDTKHVIAWVKENNPKAYLWERYNQHYPPLGDPDCRLGCKRKHNRITPTHNPRSASSVAVGEYYWGYGSGIVVTQVPDSGEFVLAEMTQTFDQSDATFFR